MGGWEVKGDEDWDWDWAGDWEPFVNCVVCIVRRLAKGFVDWRFRAVVVAVEGEEVEEVVMGLRADCREKLVVSDERGGSIDWRKGLLGRPPPPVSMGCWKEAMPFCGMLGRVVWKVCDCGCGV